MAHTSDATPLLLPGRAAQRLAAIYRQHNPGQSVPSIGQPFPAAVGSTAVKQSLYAVVLDEPVALRPQQHEGPSPRPDTNWQQSRDIHTEVCLTCTTLRKLKMVNGAFAQVASQHDPCASSHIVRLIAVDAPHHGVRALADTTLHAGSGAHSLVPSRAHQQPPNMQTKATADAFQWQDDIAYLPPSLAFNLGLQYQLWPLMSHPQTEAPANSPAAPQVGPTAKVPQSRHALGQGQVSIEPLEAVPADCRHVDLLQSGRDAAQVPLAKSMSIASISIPRIALLESPTAKGKEGDPANPAAAGDTASEYIADRSDRTAEAGTSGQSSSEAMQAEEEKLIQQLRCYFQQSTRLLTKGDVFAMASDADETAALLSSLYPSQAPRTQPPELQYFKVTGLQPSCGTSCAVDFTKTQVVLEGNCGSALPVGLPAYIAAAAHPLTSPQHSSIKSAPTSTSYQPLHDAHSQTLDQHSAAADRHHHTPHGQAELQPASRTLLCGSSRNMQIGVHASAAWQASPELPGCGPLLPSWRQLTDLLVPLVHQGSTAMALQVAALLLGPRGSGRATAVRAATAALGIHLVPFSCHDLKGQTEAHTATALKASLEAAQQFAPAVLLLRHFEVLAESAAGSSQAERTAAASRLAGALAHCIAKGCNTTTGNAAISSSAQHASLAASADAAVGCVIVVACAESADDLPASLRRCFTHELPVEAPDATARKHLIQGLLGGLVCKQLGPEALDSAVSQTAGLLPRDLHALVADAAAAAAARKLDTSQMLPTTGQSDTARGKELVIRQAQVDKGLHVSGADVQASLDGVRQRTATVIGAPKVPDVRWDDVGGLENVKRAILDTVELPLKHPSLFAAGLRQRSGVLLYGPPGTGKTLVAKAVATECSINFLSVKGPELINMYIGESERQVREIFARARRARPCVLFFDELDSLAPARGAGADSGGVMDRVVSQLLAEVDGVQAGASGGDLFVIGATNRPDLIDPALLRPGRLDVLLYVGVAEDSNSKLKVLQALTRKFKLEHDVDLPIIAEKCPPAFTGADMYALSSDAWMTALKRTVAQAADAQDVTVTQEDFWEALSNLKPSLSAAELMRYQKLKDHYESRGR